MKPKFEQVTITIQPKEQGYFVDIPEFARYVQLSSSGSYKFIMEDDSEIPFNTALIYTKNGSNLYKTYLPENRKRISFFNRDYLSFDLYVVFRS